MTRAAALLLVLTGCAPWVRGARPPESDEAAAIDAVTAAWLDAGLPWGEKCDAEREGLLVAVLDDAEMRRAVGYCAAAGPLCDGTSRDERIEAGCLLGSCVAGSMVVEASEPWPAALWAPSRITLLASSYQPPSTRLRALAHEMAHALSRCTTGSADRLHRDARVWGPGGVVSTAITGDRP